MSFECVGAGEGTAWLALPDLCWHTCLSLESTKFTLTGLFSLSELFLFRPPQSCCFFRLVMDFCLLSVQLANG